MSALHPGRATSARDANDFAGARRQRHPAKGRSRAVRSVFRRSDGPATTWPHAAWARRHRTWCPWHARDVIDRETRPRTAHVPTSSGRRWSWTLVRRALPWAGWLVWSAVLFGALWFDQGAGLIGPEGVGLAKLLVALFAVAGVLVSPWLGARALPVLAGLLAVASLTVSAVLHTGTGTSEGTLGLAEPAALLWLLLLVPVTARRWWVSWVAAPVLWCAIVLRPVSADPRETTITVALFFAVGATAVGGAGVVWRLVRADRRRRAQELRAEQRVEFARDLHDFVAHHVTGIVVQAQGARAMARRRPELVPPSLERIEQAGTEALDAMRHMVGMLRDHDGRVRRSALTPLAGMDDLRALVEGFSAENGARARLTITGSFDDLPVEITTTAHRVVMEALTNVRKHAHRCGEVRVEAVRTADGGVAVRISDDGRGRGGRHHAGSGFGLKGLTERLVLIGGELHAGPAPGGGWRVEAILPSTPTLPGAAR
ncbi:sensor histidine kinase [Streptomyces fagopyri]|uniref:sensor histidine kinase n=1 Tax=Streptomyces fagopyri TaxID=2662397 RepID=UPI0036CE954A